MALLEVEGVTRQFGGLPAVDDLSFDVQEGEILGIIGPNGAGKTTLLNLISALLPVTAGTVRFRGTTITGRPPHAIAEMGVARTFQIVKPLKGLTVRENVAVGAMFGQRKGGLPTRPALAKADEVLDFVGLGRGPPPPSPHSPSRTASASSWPGPWPWSRPSSCWTR